MIAPEPFAGDGGRLGIIGGSAFLEAVEVSGARLEEVPTAQGTVTLHVAGNFVFLRRHGEGGVYQPPHRIPHHAHVMALEALGVGRVAGFASVGALHAELVPGDVVVPDDYLSWHPPPSFARDEYLHVVPELDPHVRDLLVRAAEAALAAEAPGAGRPPALERTGVYAETRGPRFETRAEVRMLAAHARVVGMTAASEATLCQERGMRYAMLCVVDNWAHGVGPVPLTLEDFQEQLARNAQRARAVLVELVQLWHAASAPSSNPQGE